MYIYRKLYKGLQIQINHTMAESTQYVLIQKSIFDRFFKDVKQGTKRISGVINEAAIKEATSSTSKKRKSPGDDDKHTKRAKHKSESRQPKPKSSSESSLDSSTDNSETESEESQ